MSYARDYLIMVLIQYRLAEITQLILHFDGSILEHKYGYVHAELLQCMAIDHDPRLRTCNQSYYRWLRLLLLACRVLDVHSRRHAK